MGTNGQHPAWAWFHGFDVERAAMETWLARARKFAAGLRVRFTVETIDHGAVVVSEIEGPVVFSPITARHIGSGYIALEPKNPVIMAAFRAEAATALRAWRDRYALAVAAAGLPIDAIDRMISDLGTDADFSEVA